MNKRENQSVGSGITKRQEPKAIPWRDKDSAGERLEVVQGVLRDAARLWGSRAHLIEMAKSELDALETDLAVRGVEYNHYNAHFKKHESYGWYLRTIVTYSTSAELAIEKGRAQYALELAMLVGEALAEFRLKETWDDFVEKALEVKRRQAAGPKSRAKHPQRLRYECVCAELEKGVSKSEAFRRVAKELTVSASTVATNFYNERKLCSQ